MKTLHYTSIKCSLNKFCKNDYLKSKINELLLNVNKTIFERYVYANLHIIWLMDEHKEIPALTQKFFKMFWHKCLKFFFTRKWIVKMRELLHTC
jgi:hypothetical protein